MFVIQSLSNQRTCVKKRAPRQSREARIKQPVRALELTFHDFYNILADNPAIHLEYTELFK
ncbi:MAG: hypothetical protein C0611_07875 [Desulfobacteraceae bacterium]|nr:MAG: hypothetical protein C0611_07875 [Desulfobacteraceae bacterium]